MYPIIQIGPLVLPSYGLLVALGVAVAYLFALLRLRGRGLRPGELHRFLLYGLLFGFVGAKLLYVLTALPNASVAALFSRGRLADTLLFGFVYYGGLIGGFAGLLVLHKKPGTRVPALLDAALPALPLAHAFGRLGCFMAGCCYGIPVAPPVGIPFEHSFGELNHVPLFPVQLLESGLNLVLFAGLWLYTKNERAPFSGVALYACAYGVMRFFLEFLRYDGTRGGWGAFSTSQWISLFVFAAGVAWLWHQKARGARQRA